MNIMLTQVSPLICLACKGITSEWEEDALEPSETIRGRCIVCLTKHRAMNTDGGIEI
jgi:hypothetical protein